MARFVLSYVIDIDDETIAAYPDIPSLVLNDLNAKAAAPPTGWPDGADVAVTAWAFAPPEAEEVALHVLPKPEEPANRKPHPDAPPLDVELSADDYERLHAAIAGSSHTVGSAPWQTQYRTLAHTIKKGTIR